MSFHPNSDRHDELVRALHRIATSIEKGFIHMADVEAQALADLSAAVTAIGDAVAAEIGALQTALANAGVNNSPAIEASVTQLNTLAANLKASLPAAAPTPTP